MGGSRFVEDFTNLDVYRRASCVARNIFVLSQRFPPEENRALRDQLLRAARSIGAQIAEAWAKRPYPRHFRAKLTDADAEQRETRHWLRIGLECGYLTPAEAEPLMEELDRIGRMLVTMMKGAEKFRVGRYQK